MFKDKWTINISTSLCRKDRCFKSLRVQQLHAHLQTKPLLCPDLQLICRLIDAVRHVSISVLDGNGERRCSTEICVGDWLANQERNSFFLIPIEAAEVSKRIILIDKQTKAYRFTQHILVQYLKYSESYSFFLNRFLSDHSLHLLWGFHSAGPQYIGFFILLNLFYFFFLTVHISLDQKYMTRHYGCAA